MKSKMEGTLRCLTNVVAAEALPRDVRRLGVEYDGLGDRGEDKEDIAQNDIMVPPNHNNSGIWVVDNSNDKEHKNNEDAPKKIRASATNGHCLKGVNILRLRIFEARHIGRTF